MLPNIKKTVEISNIKIIIYGEVTIIYIYFNDI